MTRATSLVNNWPVQWSKGAAQQTSRCCIYADQWSEDYWKMIFLIWPILWFYTGCLVLYSGIHRPHNDEAIHPTREALSSLVATPKGPLYRIESTPDIMQMPVRHSIYCVSYLKSNLRKNDCSPGVSNCCWEYRKKSLNNWIHIVYSFLFQKYQSSMDKLKVDTIDAFVDFLFLGKTIANIENNHKCWTVLSTNEVEYHGWESKIVRCTSS